MQKITPFLWFDLNAEEAMNFYTSVFKNSKIKSINRYGPEGAKVSGVPEGTVMTGTIEIEGQTFMVLNGGPVFKFTEAVSFVVDCKDQAEVDYYWEKLSAHPESEQCGWLKDKFGLSWQIVPSDLGKLMSDPDPIKAGRVMAAMLKMKKIDIAELEKAHDQK